jgi:hypothetical protein
VVLERGVERGQLRADIDLELALDVLGGLPFYRLLITGATIDERLAEGVAELIMRGFAPRGSGQRRRLRWWLGVPVWPSRESTYSSGAPGLSK